MHRPDPFDDGLGLDDELPELPIPRPGECTAERALAAPAVKLPFGPAPLGGGASFTAVDGSERAPGPAPSPPEDPHAAESATRFTWEIAARLTAGMLANPARDTSSVKDAMAMFDKFLHEVHAYERLASSASLSAEDSDRRRREHGEYFHTAREAEQAQEAAPEANKPLPSQPAPMPGYQPLPPRARGPYVPGGSNPSATGEPGRDAA